MSLLSIFLRECSVTECSCRASAVVPNAGLQVHSTSRKRRRTINIWPVPAATAILDRLAFNVPQYFNHSQADIEWRWNGSIGQKPNESHRYPGSDVPDELNSLLLIDSVAVRYSSCCHTKTMPWIL